MEFQEKIERKYNLKTITIWGGEPVLHLERIIEILPQYINYFPL